MAPWVWVIIAIAAVLFLMLLFRSAKGAGGQRTIIRRPMGGRGMGRPGRRWRRGPPR
jgi:hypothetical protein